MSQKLERTVEIYLTNNYHQWILSATKGGLSFQQFMNIDVQMIEDATYHFKRNIWQMNVEARSSHPDVNVKSEEDEAKKIERFRIFVGGLKSRCVVLTRAKRVLHTKRAYQKMTNSV